MFDKWLHTDRTDGLSLNIDQLDRTDEIRAEGITYTVIYVRETCDFLFRSTLSV